MSAFSTPRGSGSTLRTPPLGGVSSFKIFQRQSAPPSASSGLERWATTHECRAAVALFAALGVLRSVNLVVMGRILAPLLNVLETPMVGRNLLGAMACVAALVGLITRKSPHRAVSGIYYRVISSLFVPRFVTNSVWAINADSVDWKQVIGVAGSVAGSAAGSQDSGASDIRSFRIPESSFTKRRYARSADGRRTRVLLKGEHQGGAVPGLVRARSMDRPPMSVSTPGQSPRTLLRDGPREARRDREGALSDQGTMRSRRGKAGRTKTSGWEPKMSRIVSGHSLSLAETSMMESLPLSLPLPEARTPPHRLIPEESACPLSPATSIESSGSFSRSVSEYVDSWVQSLKGGVVAGAPVSVEGEGAHQVCSPRRASLDAPGSHAHRHYVHGSVTAADATIVPLLDKYALAAQLQAKNLLERGSTAYPGHLQRTRPVPSALDSIGLDGDCPDAIRQIITDEHLLQFGDLIGERACTDLLRELSIEHACASPSALFGLPDDAAGVAWDKSSSGGKDGLVVAAERRMLRDHYFMYRTVADLHGVEPSVVRPFHLDDQARTLWDDSCISCERDIPSGETRISRHSESCMQRYICRFPRPLSGRSYEFARRVWTRPSDGGCYAICKSCPLPSGDGPSQYCLVKEYVSACCIEGTEQGTRITTVYFENNQARPGLNKIAVPKGLLPFWFKYEASLRVFAKAKQVNTRRRSLDDSAADDVVGDGGDGGDSSGSDDEVYDALTELKRRSKEHERRRRRVGREENEKITRWARRALVATALKLALDN